MIINIQQLKFEFIVVQQEFGFLEIVPEEHVTTVDTFYTLKDREIQIVLDEIDKYTGA